MGKTFNCILILLSLYVVYLVVRQINNNNINNIEEDNNDHDHDDDEKFIDDDRLFKNYYTEPSTLKLNDDIKDVDKQFMIEQDIGMNLNTYYPNTWIEYIDASGNPHYNSRENVTSKKDLIVQNHVTNSYEFNKFKIDHLDGKTNDDLENKTLKEIYDSSFVDYKKLEKKKVLKSSNDKTINGASHLSIMAPDDWIYENEKAENGGEIDDGLYAVDYQVYGSNAQF